MPLHDDKIQGIEKIGKLDLKSSQVVNKLDPTDANKEHFDSLMTKEAKNPAPPVNAVEAAQFDTPVANKKPSLIDEISDLGSDVKRLSNVSHARIIAQAQQTIDQINTIKSKLTDPNLELKDSVQTLLKNKLSHIDESLKIALSKAGVDYKPTTPVTPPSANPIDRFLGFLTDGQYQLEHLGDSMESIALKKGELSPASMLAIQIKVGYIQQELEFFTSLLNKALESTKTVMNVQV